MNYGHICNYICVSILIVWCAKNVPAQFKNKHNAAVKQAQWELTNSGHLTTSELKEKFKILANTLIHTLFE